MMNKVLLTLCCLWAVVGQTQNVSLPTFQGNLRVSASGITNPSGTTGDVLTWNGTQSLFTTPRILSVNGQQGTVVLSKADVGLGNVDNTSDLNKPISTAVQTALNLKFNLPTGTTAQYVRGDGTLATLPSSAGEATTVANTATINLSLTGTQITGVVNDGSITPTKLSQAYALSTHTHGYLGTGFTAGGGTGLIPNNTIAETDMFVINNADGTFISRMIFGGYCQPNGTFIDAPGNSIFLAGNPGVDASFSQIRTNGQGRSTELSAYNSSGNVENTVSVDPTGVYIHSGSTTAGGFNIVLQPGSALLSDNRSIHPGIQYEDDYTADFTERSLVDKGYVDAAISAGGATTTVANTATINLTKTGTQITGVVNDGSITPTKLSQAYALSTHAHAQSDVTGLTTALAGKFNIPTGTTAQYVRGDGTLATLPSSAGEATTVANTATINLSLTGTQITGVVNDGSITPTKLSQAYALSTHAHAQSDVTGLTTALAGKFDQPTGTTAQYVRGNGTLATLPVVVGESTTVANTATINLTLTGNQIMGIVNDGSITPVKLSQTYSLSTHTHTQTDVTGLTTALAGKFNTPTGTTAQYVRGDGTLATFTSGGDISNGGNTFGANITIGSNDARTLSLETSNTTRLTVGTTGIIEVFGNIHLNAALLDDNNSPGVATSMLSSTNTGVEWLPAAYIPTTIIAGISQSAISNMRYMTNNASLVTITLPSFSSPGDRILITGKGAGGWQVAQNSGQIIHATTDTTTGTAGFIASSSRYDCVELVCLVSNTEWVVQNYRGATLDVQ